MFFRLIYVVKGLDIGENDAIEFSINESELVTKIELKKIPKQEVFQTY